MADVEEDEHGEGSTLDTESEHEMAPPRQRPRLTMDPPIPAAANTQASAEQPQALAEPQQPTAPTALDQGRVAEASQDPSAVPDDEDELSLPSQEPNEEPPAATTTPHTPAGESQPRLDPATAALYEPALAETFQQQRLRINRQETLSFAPFRHRRTHGPAPYDDTANTSHVSAEQPNIPQPPAEQLAGQGFYLENLDTAALPTGWHMDMATCSSMIVSRTTGS